MQNLILYRKCLYSLALKCYGESIFGLFEINMPIPMLHLENHRTV